MNEGCRTPDGDLARHSQTWLHTEIAPANGERNNAIEQRRTWRTTVEALGQPGRSQEHCPWFCSPLPTMKSTQEVLASCHMTPPGYKTGSLCCLSTSDDRQSRHRKATVLGRHDIRHSCSIANARTHWAPPRCSLMNMEACSWELIAFLAAKWQL